VLTGRNEHLDRLEASLTSTVRHLVVLRAGLGKKQRQALVAVRVALPDEFPAGPAA
jgi:hypothetical protein